MPRISSDPRVECVIFSNGTTTNSVTKSKDLSPHASVFRDLVTVDSIRTFKPAPEVYKYLAQRMDKVGHEDKIWLVGVIATWLARTLKCSMATMLLLKQLQSPIRLPIENQRRWNHKPSA